MKALIADKVCKNFGGLKALSGVSIEVDVGERRVIIGPNGAGKTTLFHIISGILAPTTGGVYLFGEEVTSLSLYRRARLNLSQTFQLTHLFKGLTLLGNVVLALQSFKEIGFGMSRSLINYKNIIAEAEERLKEWRLWEKRDLKVSNLSYGEQRLLDIMLAVISRPRFLLLDEPTSGLTLGEARAVTSRIQGLSREMTILFIEHNMDVALSLAERVTVLHMGEVIKEGSPEEIRRDELVKKIYLGSTKGLRN
jgi:branched-chain amino acid transport system ATP-binding protein